MSNSIEALDLPIQLFVVGTVLGMTGALIHRACTGDLDQWPVIVAIPSTALFFLGLLQTVVRVLC
jgi:hypothetical protein